MQEERSRALSEVLDDLEATAHDGDISVQEIMDGLGRKSFAAMIMIFSLLAASPASAIPGLTAMVGLANAILIGQMLIGRRHVWLPGFLAHRHISFDRLCKAISWMRRPVQAVERLLRPRLVFLLHRPWMYLPLSVMLCIALFMPVMEIVPTSGSIAGGVLALFAAGILMRDGALISAGFVLATAIPITVYLFGFS